MDLIIMERLDFGRNLNLFSNKNSSTYITGKRELSLKTEIKIDTRIFYHVSIVSLDRYILLKSVNFYKFFIYLIKYFFILVDDTRVKLKDADPEVPGSDYINANYIRWRNDDSLGAELGSAPSPKIYIATQGCLPSTIPDFWQMVWQENCQVLVMTTKETERGKNKCARYWPDINTTKEYGKIKVRNFEESSTQHFTLREFAVSMEGSSVERKVCHFHFQVSKSQKYV